ncbi:hypothetical protein [Microcoleus sp. Pol12B5]|uniref:hypothetical protein n=1 Tax=Microcoleus sp. Pol12B5 TaxID=3055396 RepID=UPI002FD12B68
MTDTHNFIRYINSEALIECGVYEIDLAVESTKYSFLMHGHQECVLPPKTIFALPLSQSPIDRMAVLPAYVGGTVNFCGVKWLGSSSRNENLGLPRASATILLNCPLTGRLIAILEGSTISAMRTAAVACIAVEYTRPNPYSLGCIGIGKIGQLTVDSLLCKFPTIKDVNIYGRSKEKLNAVTKILREKHPRCVFSQSTEIKSITLQSEVLILSSTSAKPIIKIDSIPDDVLILNLSLRDADESVFLNCDYIIIDDWQECCRRGKVIYALVKNGLLSKSDIYSDLGRLVAGIDAIPSKRPSRTMVFAAGLSIHDIAFASLLYQRSIDKNIGTLLEL